MTNENCLENIKCPACGNEDTFRVEVTTMATVTDDGAEVDHGDMQWDKDSYAECDDCDRHGQLSDFFMAPPGVSPPAAVNASDDVPGTNITETHRHVFNALTSGRYENFALFSCFVNGSPTAAIVAITGDGDSFDIRPLFVAVTGDMRLSDHEGRLA